MRGDVAASLKTFLTGCGFPGSGLLLLATLFATSGCAVHYRAASGTEHLWGFGELSLNARQINSRFLSVASGSRVPGFCCDFGQGSFGISFGYIVRQRLQVVNKNDVVDLQLPRGAALNWHGRESNSLWGLGHLEMKTPKSNHDQALITGQSLAGLSASAGTDRGIKFGVAHFQQTVLPRDGTYLELSQPAASRPGLDLFSVQVDAPETVNLQLNEP